MTTNAYLYKNLNIDEPLNPELEFYYDRAQRLLDLYPNRLIIDNVLKAIELVISGKVLMNHHTYVDAKFYVTGIYPNSATYEVIPHKTIALVPIANIQTIKPFVAIE